jgi:hypothetical protein
MFSSKRRQAGAWLLVLAGFSISCGASHPRGRGWTMPSPDGCYLQVWDQPDFTGAFEFINGPRRYEHLRDLPGRFSWKGRIRSLTLGPAASAIAWSNEGFEGEAVLLTNDRRQAGKFSALSVNIESLDVRCVGTETRLADTANGAPNR